MPGGVEGGFTFETSVERSRRLLTKSFGSARRSGILEIESILFSHTHVIFFHGPKRFHCVVGSLRYSAFVSFFAWVFVVLTNGENQAAVLCIWFVVKA